MIKAIIFDFDGTLIDTAPGIVATMRETFRRMGTAEPTEQAMRATIGIPLKDALTQLGEYGEEDAQRATNLYRELFTEYELGNLQEFEGVIPTLSALQDSGIRMAVATSRDSESLHVIMDPRGMTQFFETVVTGSDNITHKPAPDLVLTLLDRMQLSADEVLVVGDTTYDIEMGNNARCRTCAVTYGNHSRQQLLTAKPTYMIDDFTQLPKIVL